MSIAPVSSRDNFQIVDEEFRINLQFAILGDVESQYIVGLSYLHGLDGEQSDEKAVHWLAAAAQKNCPGAQREFALLLQQGRGVEQDLVKAFDLLCYATGAGDGLAHYYQAKALLEGLGVEKNLVLGREEMEIVAAEGWPEARLYLQQMNPAPAAAG